MLINSLKINYDSVPPSASPQNTKGYQIILQFLTQRSNVEWRKQMYHSLAAKDVIVITAKKLKFQHVGCENIWISSGPWKGKEIHKQQGKSIDESDYSWIENGHVTHLVKREEKGNLLIWVNTQQRPFHTTSQRAEMSFQFRKAYSIAAKGRGSLLTNQAKICWQIKRSSAVLLKWIVCFYLIFS